MINPISMKDMPDSALCFLVRRGDKSATAILLERHMPLVYKLACDLHLPQGVELHDLHQEGAMAILRSAKCWDSTRGIKFCSYFGMSVKRAMWTWIGKYYEIPDLTEPAELDTHERTAHDLTPEQVDDRERVSRFMQTLSPRERDIIAHAYGLGRPRLTARQAAQVMKTPHYVYVRELRHAFEKLQRTARSIDRAES